MSKKLPSKPFVKIIVVGTKPVEISKNTNVALGKLTRKLVEIILVGQKDVVITNDFYLSDVSAV